ncbi:hypothetical protein GA0074692_1022 [Micromonospora pallida]|uniref:Uncharacterized protein n=1 Tax=Micromonospora pallida TaxID=145854 RepID=A0A1C6RUL9_9ACTN|nr:hypothetical protein [Micromonospora pallida]SCL20906.1 hypothetical protein GA0074692_1022 [Micromonospora pallida]
MHDALPVHRLRPDLLDGVRLALELSKHTTNTSSTHGGIGGELADSAAERRGNVRPWLVPH